MKVYTYKDPEPLLKEIRENKVYEIPNVIETSRQIGMTSLDASIAELYFNGTKLHMVAWRQGTGTYWVSNSVLDKLSNETMLEIAKSLRPLSR